MTKNIKLMADYCTYPLWWVGPDASKIGPFDPQILPLSQETIARLSDWQATYDQQLNLNDPVSSSFFSVEERTNFEREGIQLWKRLRQELDAEYEIIYFSVVLHRAVSNPDELELG